MQPFARVIAGDCVDGMATLPDAVAHCVITSPPYWNLRDYGHAGQIGLERSAADYVARMVEVFAEVRRILREDGTLWLNLGDSYHRGQLAGIPWRVAFALQESGWRLRQEIIWHKPNPMPESIRNRCTKAHETVFLFAKSDSYFYDADAVKEKSVGVWNSKNGFGGTDKKSAGDPRLRTQGHGTFHADEEKTGRNRRSVWTIPTRPYRGAHFAVMPPALVAPCILAGTSAEGCCGECGAPVERILKRNRKPTRPGADTKTTGNAAREGNRDPLRHITTTETIGWKAGCECNASRVPCTIFDPFAGSGTTLAVAIANGRNGIGCELNRDYIALAETRIADAMPTAKPATARATA
jgi:site-specific DNA-methyltransferase (adenine-specific)